MKTHAVTWSGILLHRQLQVSSVAVSRRSAEIHIALERDSPRFGRLTLCTTLFLAAALMYGCSSGPEWTRRAYSFSLDADPPATNASEEIVTLSRVAISPLFQSRSFTYRTAENAYKQDPYAGFLIPPERTLGESIRVWMRVGGVFGRVVEPGSSLIPTRNAEVFVNELYGDFRNASQPAGKMEIHFLCYEIKDGAPGRIVLDKVYARETSLKGKTPGDLMTSWDSDLRAIMEEVNSEYAKANSSVY